MQILKFNHLPAIYTRPVSVIPHIENAHAVLLKKLNIYSVFDLVSHLPIDCEYRHYIDNLSLDYNGKFITCIGRVLRHRSALKYNSPSQILIEVNDQILTINYFQLSQIYLKKLFVQGSIMVISGKLLYYNQAPQISHPDFVGPPQERFKWTGAAPIYPLTAGITQYMLRYWIYLALKKLVTVSEWIPEKLIADLKWPSFLEAIINIHDIQNEADLSPFNPARQRLAFEELLLHQFSLKKSAEQRLNNLCSPLISTGKYIDSFLAKLGFQLTPDQQQAFAEIKNDLTKNYSMMRLLQGDVGSGKTVVAFLTALIAVENNKQSALLVPTEILAQQHFTVINNWCDQLKIKCCLLTGKITAAQRRQITEQIKNGEINIVIGTHALFQDKISYQNLSIIIIDEQHRFGVMQRQSLTEKGKNIHVLMMTATPIPRTLMLATLGDLSTSYIRHKPGGRQEPVTTVMPLMKLGEVIISLKRILDTAQKVYWICPLVEASEKLDLAAVKERSIQLTEIFPNQVGLIHGKMNSADKENVMKKFLSNEIKILVATTVIEVGVNDPDATIMVIEHAERFGLAQLHQLRGRIGRGHKSAYCILLYQSPLSEATKARLSAIRETNDGFKIAEVDWRLRGGGDVIGLRQSGLPSYRFVDLNCHNTLLNLAAETSEKYQIDFTNSQPYFSVFNIPVGSNADKI